MQATECFVEVQAKLILRWTHRSFCLFCRNPAQISYVRGSLPQTRERFIKLEGMNVTFVDIPTISFLTNLLSVTTMGRQINFISYKSYDSLSHCRLMTQHCFEMKFRET